MKSAVILIAMLLAGCGDDMVETKHVQTVQITWTRATPEKCSDAKSPMGCAVIVENGDCYITMPAGSKDWLIAHEVKHCFGMVHKTGNLL